MPQMSVWALRVCRRAVQRSLPFQAAPDSRPIFPGWTPAAEPQRERWCDLGTREAATLWIYLIGYSLNICAGRDLGKLQLTDKNGLQIYHEYNRDIAKMPFLLSVLSKLGFSFESLAFIWISSQFQKNRRKFATDFMQLFVCPMSNCLAVSTVLIQGHFTYCSHPIIYIWCTTGMQKLGPLIWQYRNKALIFFCYLLQCGSWIIHAMYFSYIQSVTNVLGPDIREKSIGKIHLVQFDAEGVFGWIPTHKQIISQFFSGVWSESYWFFGGFLL